jgi:hypothetical protein
MKDNLNYIYSYILYQNRAVAPGYKNKTISSKGFTDAKRGRKCGFQLQQTTETPQNRV